jgi:hypothetical protein
MAVNKRRVKKANHGNRPCSNERQKKSRIRTPR